MSCAPGCPYRRFFPRCWRGRGFAAPRAPVVRGVEAGTGAADELGELGELAAGETPAGAGPSGVARRATSLAAS
ncbi:MAG TPA: hypothetical protein VEP49_02135, partial [Acidimicrobiia bacterium]|nr:hypothetical protein [Acidimicrobiia bacterium]